MALEDPAAVKASARLLGLLEGSAEQWFKGGADEDAVEARIAERAEAKKKLCDEGSGDCVECLVANDCPGTDTECAFRTCNMGVCGVGFTPAGTQLGTQTNDNGEYRINNVPPGPRQVRVQRIGFAVATSPVTVGAGERPADQILPLPSDEACEGGLSRWKRRSRPGGPDVRRAP